MSESTTELVRGAYDAFGRGDMEIVMQVLQDTEWHEAEGAPQGGVYTGAEAIVAGVFGPLMQQVPGFTVTPQEILPVGEDRVLAVGTYTGQGADGALKARFAHLWTLSEGRATHFEQFADTALLRRAVGQ
ncbi:MAG TPA: nuclear transport factor 2 family protein [Dermatophilaceae bacterium]|nr:nuclear transport factor 2 family protein [Dermatophilaceae bacterium]